jgi:hypothetical protein
MSPPIHPLWAACLVARSLLSWAVYRAPRRFVPWLSGLLAVMGGGFVYKAVTGSNAETQVARVFWHSTRYVHGALYLLAAGSLLYGMQLNASLLVLTDVCFSVLYRIMT